MSYSFKYNKYNLLWTLKILRVFILLSQSVLFLPLLGLFISILQCKNMAEDSNETSRFVHYMFNELDCWTGIHLFYAFTGIISAIIFCVISLTSTAVYYENKISSYNQLNKFNSRPEIMNLINKIICCLAFTFLAEEGFQWTLITLLFVLSLVMFVQFQNTDVYYNDKVHSLWRMYSAIYF